MARSPLQHGTWLAICDGARALLVENVGDRQFPKLETRAHFAQENPPARELASSGPGRVFSSVGKRRGAVDQTDFHEQAEHDFLRKFADEMARAVKAHDIRSLYLVAPAKALGIMRSLLPDTVHRVLAGELDRDYVKMPLHEVERHLKAREP
ncbi:MAG TPA: host attachment family protein [Rhizomicrobium sp.]|nr:host attachment family protein [Rhizomicrobium sp.]